MVLTALHKFTIKMQLTTSRLARAVATATLSFIELLICMRQEFQ